MNQTAQPRKQTTFQKYFFAFIFLVTLGAFVQMYVEHQSNLEQKDCVTRTRDLLDYITAGSAKESYLIWPHDQVVLDSAIVLLEGWGKEARLDDYKRTETDSGYTEAITVFYPGVAAGPEALDEGLLKVGLRVTWDNDTRRVTWRARIDLIDLK